MFENPARKIKRKGRFYLCNSSHYYDLLHLFHVAALILNGQNNLNPAMKMCKVWWAFFAVLIAVPTAITAPWVVFPHSDTHLELQQKLDALVCIQEVLSLHLWWSTPSESLNLSPLVLLFTLALKSKHVKQSLRGKCLLLFTQRKNSLHFLPKIQYIWSLSLV